MENPEHNVDNNVHDPINAPEGGTFEPSTTAEDDRMQAGAGAFLVLDYLMSEGAMRLETQTLLGDGVYIRSDVTAPEGQVSYIVSSEDDSAKSVLCDIYKVSGEWNLSAYCGEAVVEKVIGSAELSKNLNEFVG